MKKIIGSIFIVVFLIQSISAYTYLNIYIDETGNALFLGETNEKLILPENIKISNGVIKGATQNLTKKIGEVWEFEYKLEGAELYVILPKGAVIKNLNNGEISLEKDRFSVYAKENIKVEYEINSVDEKDYLWFYLVIIVILIIIGFYSYKKYFLKAKNIKKNKIEKKIDKIRLIEKILNEREKKIINKLKKTGKIKTSHLRKLCEIPKASFSRHLQELEKKKLIKRSGEGKNKFVELFKN